MESMYICFRDMGIKIQVLCPGFVQTDFHKRDTEDKSVLVRKRKIPWMLPDEVVEISIKNLRKNNKVIIIPGFWNKFIKFMFVVLPRPLYYRLAHKFLI